MESIDKQNPQTLFNDECVHFNFKIPSFNHRTKLFEKIFYLIEGQCFDEKTSVSTISKRKQKGQSK